ncbi:MAG: DHH family phosphoesterase [Oscillospiraceae bacterium]|nr:DHH family phosphoesterase [Oscillospiraceae bacterium]
MDNKLPRFLRPSMRLYFILLIIFAVVTFFFGSERHILAISEFAVIALLAIYTRVDNKKRADRLAQYLEAVTDGIDTAAESSLTRSPLPVVVFSTKSCNILWSNELFRAITDDRERMFEVRVSDLVPDFDSDWLRDGRLECPEPIALGDRLFKLYGSLARFGGARTDDFIATTYWVDVTAYERTRSEFYLSRPVYTIILLDNYEDLTKGVSEQEKSAVLSEIDAKIGEWTSGRDGYLCKYDRDRYLYVTEERHLDDLVGDKFKILEAVRECIGAGGVHATLSIGIGKDGKTPLESSRFASLAIEMALTRGGDQAVIKNHFNFEFFGGNSAEPEKRTKVKARVMANALGELIADSSSVFIMGHKNADFDAVGAAAGVRRIALSKSVPAYIVIDPDNTMSKALIEHLKSAEDYEDAFISVSDAMIKADSRSLLVVVDTSRPEETESQDLLLSLTRVAVIDHHRRAATYIENATVNFNEPYASSACELVTELLQYIVDQRAILRVEADALLTGIVLDTKTFAIRTGSRTFDAAAFLRRLGADTVDVKMLMQSDYSTAMARYELVRGAKIYHDGIAVASSDAAADRVVIAQSADELLNIAGVSASFVLAPNDGGIFISGRSIGNVNVQLILERLGGGGNQSIAGGRMEGVNASGALAALHSAIDEYLAENPK